MNQSEDIFEVACPNCGTVKKARRSDDGKRIRCGCGTPFTITAPSVLTHDNPRDGRETSRRPCPICGEMIVATAVKCRFCGEIIRAQSEREPSRRRVDDDDNDAAASGRMKYCHECGRQIRQRAEICPNCGVRQPDSGARPNRAVESRDKIKTLLLISAISNIVLAVIWLCTIIGVVLTVPMVILCICEFGLRSKADDLPLKQLGEKAKTIGIFEIVVGLFNTPTFVCGIILVITSGKVVRQYDE